MAGNVRAMTPWELAKDTEHSQQRALFAWANCAALFGFYAAQYGDCYNKEKRDRAFALGNGLGAKGITVPELSLFFAIHNQGHGDRIRGAQAKAEGVKAGVPDMFLPVMRVHPEPEPYRHVTRPYYGLFIELKKTKKGIVSDEQIVWAGLLSKQGYAVSICKGWIEAANCIMGYLGSSIRLEDGEI